MEKPFGDKHCLYILFTFGRSKHPHISFICSGRNFDHPLINAVTFVRRKQSKKPQFKKNEHSFCRESLRYVSAVKFVLTF